MTDLNLAMIVTHENYDSINKLNTMSREIAEYLKENPVEVNKTLKETSPFYKWIQKEIEELNEMLGAIDYSIIKLKNFTRYRKIQYHVNELHDTRKKLRSFLEDKKN